MKSLHSHLRAPLFATLAFYLITVPTPSIFAQPMVQEPLKASAIKLPDGTVVFFTKNPEDVNPAIDGIVLSPKEYKALVEQADLARKAKSQAPSSVAIRGRIELRGERLIAALNLKYSFRTIEPRVLLALGCQRGVLIGARTGAGKLPILNPPGDDGLTLLVETPGEQTVTLDVEVAVAARGARGESGFELGLPRAAITTFKLDGFPAGIRSVSLGTRVAEAPSAVPFKPAELRHAPHSVEQLLSKAVPLGATDALELTWDPPAPAASSGSAIPTVDADLTVRAEEASVETVAKLRLRGNAKEWSFQFPPGTDVVVEKVGSPGATPTSVSEGPPTVVRPADPNKPTWLIRTPGDGTAAEWVVTATTRVQRPKPNDPKFRGPYAIGPFVLLANAKQTGRMNVFTGPTVRLSFKHPPEFRRQNLPATATDDHTASFTYAALAPLSPNAKAAPWLELDARVAPTAIRAKASHQLLLTPGGWKLETTVRIVPPPRGEVEQLVVEMPADWTALEASPEDLIEGIHIVQEGAPRLLAIRFNGAQKAAFVLKLLSASALLPKAGPAEDRESKLSLALPRFPQAEEREASVVASVPEGFEVRGGVSLWEGGQPSAAADPLTAVVAGPGRSAAVGSVSGTFGRPIARVDLSWQAYRPLLACDNRVDVSLQPKQLLVQQVLKFKPSQDDRRPIRLRGAESLLGLQSVPPLEPIGPGLWEFRPAEPGKEFSLTVAFAIRMSGPAADPRVALLWPESATRIDSVLRVWGGATGRSVNGYTGEWREVPPEAVPGRESIPLLSLAASITAAPLTLDLSAPAESGLPTVWIERAYVQAGAGEETATIHAKLLVKRWLGPSLEVELPRVESIEISVDGKRVEALPNGSEGDPYLLAIPLPESKAGRAVEVDLRYRYPSARSERGARLLKPPLVRGALYRSPLRWTVTSESDTVALLPSGKWDPEFQWVWRGAGFTPTASDSPRELDAWLRAGAESEADDLSPGGATGGETTAGRQTAPEAIGVMLVPRSAWITACASLLFVVGLATSRLRRTPLAFAIAALGIVLAVAAAASPQSLAQVLSAMQPGAVLLAFALASRAAWRSYRARRLARLPGFSRERPAPLSAPHERVGGKSKSRAEPASAGIVPISNTSVKSVRVGSDSGAPPIPSGVSP